MSPIRHRRNTAGDCLPSLGLALDPSYHQSVRQEPYRSNRAIRFEPYESDDDFFDHSVAYQPSLLFSTSIADVQANVQDNEVPDAAEAPVGAEDNYLVAAFKKVVAAVKRVFGVVLKV